MTKSLASKICLKERLDMFSMAKGTSIQNHLDEFNYIIFDLKNLDVKIKDEGKTTLLVVSLYAFYKHFKRMLLYINNDTLSFANVKTNLLCKEKFDLEVRAKKKVKAY